MIIGSVKDEVGGREGGLGKCSESHVTHDSGCI